MDKEKLLKIINESQEQYALTGYYDDGARLVKPVEHENIGGSIDRLLVGIVERNEPEQAADDLKYAIQQLTSALSALERELFMESRI